MKLVFFDTETGGLEPHHPTIQIAAIATENFREVAAFERKIRFDVSAADPAALRLNSYDAETWELKAQDEEEVVTEFAVFLHEHSHCEMISKRTGRPYKVARLAGHNAATFDAPRLQALYRRHNMFLPASPQVLCTAQLALWFTGGSLKSYKLSDLCAEYGIESDGAHDALADVRMCARLASCLVEGLR
jgi:DNA polymerase III epsilon subunit-like protein